MRCPKVMHVGTGNKKFLCGLITDGVKIDRSRDAKVRQGLRMVTQ